MITTRSKMQSQGPSPPKSNAGETTMEENGNHAAETSESEVDRQAQKCIEQLRSEITTEIKK